MSQIDVIKVRTAAERVGKALWEQLEWLRARLERAWEAAAQRRADANDRNLDHAFQPDAAALEEAPISLSLNTALYVVLAVLGIALIWSIVGSVDKVVVADGKVATKTPLVVMQPYTTSRVMRLAVEAGDHVRKGQVLAAFDPAFARADVHSLAMKEATLTAKVARLQAQLDGDPFPVGPGADAAKRTEAQIYQQETATYTAELAKFTSQIQGLQSQIEADQQNISGLQEQLVMAKKVVGIRRYLLKEKAGAPLDVMVARSNQIDIANKLAASTGEEKKLEQERDGAVSQRDSFISQWRSDHNEKLVSARQDLSEAQDSLAKARKISDFTNMVAPLDGTVLEVADRSVGSVLQGSETLMTLVPDGAKLYVDADVSTRDIAEVKVGDKVQVKLQAYPFQRYGTVTGRLVSLGADSVPVKAGAGTRQVYHAQVVIDDAPSKLASRGIHVRPGLVADADITTGSRSIISYILDPLLRTAHDSMREP